ncbi:hypothetical protein RR42_m3505 [Cupriavidus basilensis]|uniref:Uncharacterized protein n=1 Tax=Cupriavidus basilensis TaxID=68895 RepID=A0A0C4YJJ6_9BURK|nr:hypothetical protein RR42_m3505 [Cupriavidus basilensis]
MRNAALTTAICGRESSRIAILTDTGFRLPVSGVPCHEVSSAAIPDEDDSGSHRPFCPRPTGGQRMPAATRLPDR